MLETFVIKYHPAQIKDMILAEEAKIQLLSFIENKSIPHLLFPGPSGVGKTTTAKLLAKELDADLLFVKASMTNSVDHVRNKIKEFTDSLSMDRKLKIVVLDEADGLSDQAQEALRNLIDMSQDDTRFIFTCNYIHKIIQPLKSRCQLMDITFDIKQLALYIKKIFDLEEVHYEHDIFASLIKTINQKIFPDIRASINYAESCVINKNLIVKDYISADKLDKFAEQIYQQIINRTSFYDIRKFIIKSQEEFNEMFESLLGSLFNYIADKASNELEFEVVGKCLKIISSYIVRVNRVEINKEIQFVSCILELQGVI